MTDQAFVVLPKPGSVRRRVDNPFVGSEEVAPLPPKRRENTYKYEAVYEFERGLRGHVVYPVYTTTCTQFVRRTNGPAIWELVV